MSLRLSQPKFFENSKVPVLLSYVSPITIGAITLGPFVFSRGILSERTKRHETIHWQQYIETGIIGFLILYSIYWIAGLIKYRDGSTAYYRIPFEQEAYENDDDIVYLLNRKRFNWFWRKI
tara:strand:+ start:70 stop:432 length:363 start_codon:yes stop_codon:yes gene_type:complete